MTGAARLTALDPGEMSAPQLDLYGAIAGGPRARGPQSFALTDSGGALVGPFNAMLRSPAVGTALQALGSAVRYGSAFGDRAREIAILVVAHRWRSEFEIYAHEAVGRSVGLSEDDLSALGEDRPDALDDPFEHLVAVTTAALVDRSELTDGEYADAIAGLGEAQLFELTTLVGYYSTLALQLRVFRVGVPVPTPEGAA